MPATKRKALEASLQRRVKARRESSEDIASVASVPSSDSGDNLQSDHEVDSDSGESEEEVRTIRLSFKQCLR